MLGELNRDQTEFERQLEEEKKKNVHFHFFLKNKMTTSGLSYSALGRFVGREFGQEENSRFVIGRFQK